ncbi:Hypothetical predicted protein [Mytilus galloprovincialis]|uniref:Uncharacterized protein n=1 Tax=Mytilus galloprovincialis TaxID=29158 RepID=A0A8B6BG28_MYTGA|nr:Hypothetical predicted protein [Mytilus galloprovincialis]
MKTKLETVKEVNIIRIVKEPSHIPVATDTRYNSMHIVSSKTGQNASQTISLACEQVTDHKFIVASVFHNKLCWTGSWLKGKGLNVTCPDGHAGTCTANVKPTNPSSEYLMGKEIGLDGMCTYDCGVVKVDDVRRFITGCSAVPPGGFDARFSIGFTEERKYPTVTTCTGEVVLPLYLKNYNTFKDIMIKSIDTGPGFGQI